MQPPPPLFATNLDDALVCSVGPVTQHTHLFLAILDECDMPWDMGYSPTGDL